MTLTLADIQIRDPYLVTHEGAYYLFGSTDPDIWHPPGIGFDCYHSTDLQQWQGPIAAFRPPPDFWSDRDFWAPEAHHYRGRWYLFATFHSPERRRGTQILVSDRPEGPYRPFTDGPVTPEGWECLDGTLHVEDGVPWIVYCHEWVQVWDGEVVAQRLRQDLSAVDGDPIVLFHGSDAPWARPLAHPRVPAGESAFVTDGPFLHRTGGGELLMLWSSFGDAGYAMGVARSESGGVRGPWVQQQEAVWSRDGGHGMVARTLDGELLLTLHQPNTSPLERAVLRPVREAGGTLQLVDTPADG